MNIIQIILNAIRDEQIILQNNLNDVQEAADVLQDMLGMVQEDQLFVQHNLDDMQAGVNVLQQPGGVAALIADIYEAFPGLAP